MSVSSLNRLKKNAERLKKQLANVLKLPLKLKQNGKQLLKQNKNVWQLNKLRLNGKPL